MPGKRLIRSPSGRLNRPRRSSSRSSRRTASRDTRYSCTAKVSSETDGGPGAAQHRAECARLRLGRAAHDELDLGEIKIGGDREKIHAGEQRRQPTIAQNQMFSDPRNRATASARPRGRAPAIAPLTPAWDGEPRQPLQITELPTGNLLRDRKEDQNAGRVFGRPLQIIAAARPNRNRKGEGSPAPPHSAAASCGRDVSVRGNNRPRQGRR